MTDGKWRQLQAINLLAVGLVFVIGIALAGGGNQVKFSDLAVFIGLEVIVLGFGLYVAKTR